MIKILHSADWHLDAPMRQFSEEQRRLLRREMLALPGKIVELAQNEGCDLMLLSGDIFDGPYTPECAGALRDALARAEMPVFIAPGNHDFYGEKSPWFQENWPGNVHIFTSNEITSVPLPELDARVYGAGFSAMDCPGLLPGFAATCGEKYALMVLHGDPTAADSPYNPVTAAQVRDSGLDYLALGHIHAAGRFGAGAGMCAWPGCPMGRGWDETGVKGVLVVELDQQTTIRFVPLDVPRFYDWTVPAGENPAKALEELLPAAVSEDFFRVRFTGEGDGVNLGELYKEFASYPNLKLLDGTVKREPLWGRETDDTLEGAYFRLLRQKMMGADEQTCRELELAAKLSRQILRGSEVELP